MIQQKGRLVYEQGDCPLVNTLEEAGQGATRYIVKIWSGSSNYVDGFLVWAFSEENALVEVVNFIRQYGDLKKRFLIRKQELFRLFQNLEQEGHDALDAHIIINATYEYVNGRPWYKFKEYIRSENLAVLEADEAHYSWYK